jgi:hypothetical protein
VGWFPWIAHYVYMTKAWQVVVLIITSTCAVACTPRHPLIPIPDAVLPGGSAATGGAATGGASGAGGVIATGGAIGTGGVTGTGGQDTGGAGGQGGSSSSTIVPVSDGAVIVDCSIPEPSWDGGLYSGSITVTALIDGLDNLHVVPTGLFWEHLSHAGPGMHGYQTLPTTVTSDLTCNGSWCPVWANGCNTCDGSCGELREKGQSATFSMNVFPGTIVSSSFSCSGRGSCTLLQSPTGNDPEAIIELDDVEPPGPSTYSATLSFVCRR